MTKETILTIKNLHTSFFNNSTEIPVLRGINLDIEHGKILALAGESGCGKTITALSILRLVPYPGRIVNGNIIFAGKDLLSLPENKMRKVRGKKISLISQEPGLALNPVYTIGNQIAEVIKLHRKDIRDIRKETIRLLKLVRIPGRIRSYPHQLSGGMQQRALIAMAIAGRPKLLIADEPTTALDVTIQAQILQLLKNLTKELDMSILLITHDLGIAAEVADTAAIMYAGKIVEYTDIYTLFKNPLHPYTKGLLESIPRMKTIEKKLPAIPGIVPDPAYLPQGCSFNPRCRWAQNSCRIKTPQLKEQTPGHWVSCDKIKIS